MTDDDKKYFQRLDELEKETESVSTVIRHKGTMPQLNSPELRFGVNPFDRVPDLRGRYHVIDEDGYTSGKYQFGIYAYDAAGRASDERHDVTFRVIDTRDGSIYGAYRNGIDTDDRTDAGRALTERKGKA